VPWPPVLIEYLTSFDYVRRRDFCRRTDCQSVLRFVRPNRSRPWTHYS
jgi:hypothetical protein